MLHGSPATIVLGSGGIKMAGGHPGREIGDEERRFLKGWVEKEKTRGMVDMVAFRFGDYTNETANMNCGIAGKQGQGQRGYWFWGNSAKASIAAATSPQKGNSMGPALIMSQDGCIFPGTGALETHSVRDISTYISELYQHGDEASARSSGVRKPKRDLMKPREPPKPRNFPSTERKNSPVRLPRRSNSTSKPAREESEAATTPPLAGIKLKSAVRAEATEGSNCVRNRVAEVTAWESSKSRSSSNTNAKILNLLTFRWSGGSTKSNQTANNKTGCPNAAKASSEPEPLPTGNVVPRAESVVGPEDSGKTKAELGNTIKRARFAIGFLGDLYADDLDDDLKDENSSGRITSRTVWVERRKKVDEDVAVVVQPRHRERCNNEVPMITRSDMEFEEFRIVVYIVSHTSRSPTPPGNIPQTNELLPQNHPLIFAFIFNNSAPQLTSPASYRTLHHQLSPLLIPLLKSSNFSNGALPTTDFLHRPPYDIFYNPSMHTIHSTVPPIPEPGSNPDLQIGWTRVDAFHVHTLILGILSETRSDRAERERSARSTKGWWINWMRLEGGEEGIVVRRAGENKVDLMTGAGAGVGVGVDFRRYVEGLVTGAR